ncbi:MAG: sigma-54-dependent Fis family transcriptional regulator [Nitrospinae bacterium]|nr:sigma-54-dependent Fis family transcriptional regulator [Nitrospinota bacterium]
MASRRVLIYEKNLHRAAELRQIVEAAGFSARAAFSAAEAGAVLERERFDALMAGFDSLPLPPAVENVGRIIISVPRVMRAEVDATVSRYGLSAEVVEHPFDAESVGRLLKTGARIPPTAAQEAPRDVPSILGSSPAICDVKELVLKAAGAPSTVLILGETGVGKELVARALHDAGPRAKKPFVAVNCAAAPETLLETEFFGHERGAFTGAAGRRSGKFELAADGTIFLDEMGDISPLLQAKLLRVLEEGSFYRVGGEKPAPMRARIVCATNRDIFKMAQAGSFRRDLLYRINVIPIRIPPLRERGGDVPVLAEHFLKKYAGLFHKPNVDSFSPEATEKMAAYGWPGNVRQLANVVERAVLHCDGDVIKDVPLGEGTDATTPSPPVIKDLAGLDYASMKDRVMEHYEREYISAVLTKANGSMREACGLSGMDRKTLYRKVRQFGLDKKDFKPKRRP